MWYFDSIEIKNCFSIKQASYIFKSGQCILLTGENCDKSSGQKINGTGKSAFLESISIGVTGETLRKIKNADIVFNGEDECNIILSMSNSKTKERMKIDRSLFVKGSSTVDVYINDKLVEGLPKVDEKNQFIIRKIGITVDDLLNYFIISKEKYISFLRSGDVAKKQLINRFSKADVLDALKDVFDKKLTDVQNNVTENEKEKFGYTSQLELLQRQIDELTESDFEVYKTKRISEIEELIVADNQAVTLLEIEITTIESEVAQLNNEKNEINTEELEEKLKIIDQQKIDTRTKYDKLKVDFNKIKQEREEELNLLNELKTELQNQFEQKKTELRQIDIKITALDKQILGKVDCPKCNHEFLLSDKNIDVAELKKQKLQYETDAQKLEEEQKEIALQVIDAENDIKTVNKEIEEKQKDVQQKITLEVENANKIANDERETSSKLNDLNVKISKIESQIKIKNQTVENKRRSIDFKNQSINKFNEQIEEVKNSKDTKQDELNKKNLQKSDLNEMIECVDIILNSLADEREEIKKWELYFKSFKSHLANKSIITINNFVNHYLEKIGSNLTIMMSGYKVKGNGDLKEQISVEVLRNGISEGDFNKFSAGEKGRVDICCILALQNLINLASDSGGLEFVAIDEILDSVDSYGIDSIVKSMDILKRTVFIITQNVVNEKNSNILTARKTNGVTELIES